MERGVRMGAFGATVLVVLSFMVSPAIGVIVLLFCLFSAMGNKK